MNMSCTISLIDVINPAEDFIKAVQREQSFFAALRGGMRSCASRLPGVVHTIKQKIMRK